VDIRASLELAANGVAASVAVVDTSTLARIGCLERVAGAVFFGRSRAWPDSAAEHIHTSGTGRVAWGKMDTVNENVHRS